MPRDLRPGIKTPPSTFCIFLYRCWTYAAKQRLRTYLVLICHRDIHCFFVVSRYQLQLQVLDLSENMIEDVDTQELPHTLVIVSMAGNPCCREPSFRQRITCTLPALKVSR